MNRGTLSGKLGGLMGLVLTFATQQSWAESPVAQEAKIFRVQAYQTFRHDRPRYDELRKLDQHLQSQWQEAGQPESRAGEVLAWYQAAGLASAGKLPAVPDFTQLIAERQAAKKEASFLFNVSRTSTSPAPAAAPLAEEATASDLDSTALESSGVGITRSLTRAVVNAFTSSDEN